MTTIKLSKTTGVIFLILFSSFSASSQEFTKSLKANVMKFCLLFVSVFVFVNLGFSQETGGPYTTDENTVLLMHFEDNVENSTDVGVDGILHGSGVSYETSRDGHGNCIRLDNSTADKQSWIEVPFYDELNFTEEFSIECWFKINSWGEDHTYLPNLFRKGEDWAADYNLEFGSSENRLQANLNCQNDEYGRGFNTGTYPDVIQKNTWYHISLTFKPQTEPEYWMYMDLLIRDENYNEIYATTGFGPTPPFNSDGKFFIGFGNNDNSYFDGWIDEFRISNKHRKYRDDIIAEINTENLQDSVQPMLRDRWTVYYDPICKYFPVDTVTGERGGNSCGMTIMIRLLHFWEHPRFPSGNLDYWFGPVHWQADFDNTEYLFDLMPNKFGPNPTEEEYGPSALFAQQISAATRKYYDQMNSMTEFLVEHFHFKDTMKMYFRHQFTKEEWIKIFKYELGHGRPIMAAGLEELYDEGGAAGHYYIVDGYNSEGKFHSDESFGDVDFWVDIDSFPYGKFQTIFVGAEPDWQGKTLTLDYPKEDEYFEKESEIEINWSSGNIEKVLIEYTTDAGRNWQTIAENINASLGKYSWIIPDLASEEYKVRVSDSEDGNIYRRTGMFSVFDIQQLEFTYPKQNTQFLGGVAQPVYWQSEGIQAFKLEYSVDGTNWTLISDSIHSSNKIEFEFPEINVGNTILRATDLLNNELIFTSESFDIITDESNSFVKKTDENTVLLMHFEEDLNNAATTSFQAYESSMLGTYVENYAHHLGKAFQFYNSETTNHSLFVPHDNELDLVGSWTIEMWFKINSLNAELINKPSNNGENYNIHVEAPDGHMEARFYDTNGIRHQIGTPSATIKTNNLYHVTFTNDSSIHALELTIRNENFEVIFNETLSYPAGTIPSTGDADLTIGYMVDGYIDELRISKEAVSHIETEVLTTSLFTDISCYPNPLTSTSIITFTNTTSGKVNLSVYDLQGRKICTILDKNMPQGKHNVSLNNQIQTNGVYLCKLSTSEGISTIKLVVNK